MNKILFGAANGMIATVPMTTTMVLLDSLFSGRRRRPLPPQEITDHFIDQTDLKKIKTKPKRRLLATVLHFGFGSAMGSLFSRFSRKLPGSPLIKGIGFGLAVWAISYTNILPKLGFQPSVKRQPRGRNLSMILAHLAWGAVLGAMDSKFRDTKKIK